MGDKVGDMTPHAKKCKKSAPARQGVKCEDQMWVIFIWFVARLWKPHFYEDQHRFCSR